MPGTPYADNLRLNELEYTLGRTYLRSMPRCLGLVIGNGCNIDCVHCYQAKNGDNLLRPPEVGRALRREFEAFYPYLTTLRLQGGEVFALRGFAELLEDAAAIKRPIVSISTNGTLIDDAWAERIVRTPLRTVTISIDGAQPSTFARLRRGADLDTVLAAARRIRRWKQKLGSELPYLDCFFVIMRSTFREISVFLQLMRDNGIDDVILQTLELTEHNTARTPGFAEAEVLRDPAEIRELHAIVREALDRQRPHFRTIRWCGLETLFASQGLDSAFLQEGAAGLYPDAEALDGRVDLCPNAWTTLFVIENGDVHLCFLAQPVGNIYSTPLIEIWNSPQAQAKRSRMAAGRYTESGCAPHYCSWRDGHAMPESRNEPEIVREIRAIEARLEPWPADSFEPGHALTSVRRMLSSREARILELEAALRQAGQALESGQLHIDHLESAARESESLLAAGQQHIDHLESKAAKAVADFESLRGNGFWNRLRGVW